MFFRESILEWYFKNKRDLPWRNTKDPYKIWVSEIILQQTKIEQGLPYYIRFIEQFPDIKELASASEQSVLNVWKGLGYYSRARNMHATALEIIKSHDGIFPKDNKTLIQLKGIGPYTAAAISSICYNERVAAIDGNVTRVLSRYFGVSENVGSSRMIKKLQLISQRLIDKDNPGDYNQALMEYGAKICTPLAPQCESCSLRMSCFAYNNEVVHSLPVKKRTVTKKQRYFNYLHLVTPDGKVLLKQRRGNDIWQNLWEFPLIEDIKLLESEDIPVSFIKDCLRNFNDFLPNSTCNLERVKDSVHILTHQVLNVRFFTFSIGEVNSSDLTPASDYILMDPDDNNVPVSRLIQNFLRSS